MTDKVIERLRAALTEIVSKCDGKFSLDNPSDVASRLRDHEYGCRLAWSVAARIARAALADVPQADAVDMRTEWRISWHWSYGSDAGNEHVINLGGNVDESDIRTMRSINRSGGEAYFESRTVSATPWKREEQKS